MINDEELNAICLRNLRRTKPWCVINSATPYSHSETEYECAANDVHALITEVARLRDELAAKTATPTTDRTAIWAGTRLGRLIGRATACIRPSKSSDATCLIVYFLSMLAAVVAITQISPWVIVLSSIVSLAGLAFTLMYALSPR